MSSYSKVFESGRSKGWQEASEFVSEVAQQVNSETGIWEALGVKDARVVVDVVANHVQEISREQEEATRAAVYGDLTIDELPIFKPILAAFTEPDMALTLSGIQSSLDEKIELVTETVEGLVECGLLDVSTESTRAVYKLSQRGLSMVFGIKPVAELSHPDLRAKMDDLLSDISAVPSIEIKASSNILDEMPAVDDVDLPDVFETISALEDEELDVIEATVVEDDEEWIKVEPAIIPEIPSPSNDDEMSSITAFLRS